MLLYNTVESKMSSNLKNEEKETLVISLGGKERTPARKPKATHIHQREEFKEESSKEKGNVNDKEKDESINR